MDSHYNWSAADARDWCNVVDKIETQIRIEQRVDGICGGGQEESVAVCGCSHDQFGYTIWTGLGPVLNNKVLSEPV
jgi:hypothetical protein